MPYKIPLQISFKVNAKLLKLLEMGMSQINKWQFLLIQKIDKWLIRVLELGGITAMS